MKKEFQIGKTKVGDGHPCFIIAEVGINFDGKWEQACALIDAAAKAGCNAVKFQLFTEKKMYPENAGDYQIATGEKRGINKIVKDAELSPDWIPKLKEYAHSANLEFFASVFDEVSSDVMEKHTSDAYKIASSEMTHIPLIRHVARKKKPVILSCGMARLSELARAVELCEEEGNFSIGLLHCIARYPCPLEGLNLNVLGTLDIAFPQAVVGFSDHTSDPVVAPKAAVILGAKIIEKHITLNRRLSGPDHSFALEPLELKQMVQVIRRTEDQLQSGVSLSVDPKLSGTFQKKVFDGEKTSREFLYRSLFAVRDIQKGELFDRENIAVLRPGENKRGLPPDFYEVLVDGYRAVRDITRGTSLTYDDILQK